MKIEHVMRGYTGTMGAYVLDLTDRLFMRQGAEALGFEAPELPAMKPFEYPVVKRFFASPEGSGLKQDAYELYSDVYTAVQSINRLKKEGRIDELNSFIQSRQNLLAVKSGIYAVKRHLDKARKYKSAILRSDIDPELKRYQIDQLDAEINEMLKVMPELKRMADQKAFRSTY